LCSSELLRSDIPAFRLRLPFEIVLRLSKFSEQVTQARPVLDDFSVAFGSLMNSTPRKEPHDVFLFAKQESSGAISVYFSSKSAYRQCESQ
jgi:hypothetical protein